MQEYRVKDMLNLVEGITKALVACAVVQAGLCLCCV